MAKNLKAYLKIETSNQFKHHNMFPQNLPSPHFACEPRFQLRPPPFPEDFRAWIVSPSRCPLPRKLPSGNQTWQWKIWMFFPQLWTSILATFHDTGGYPTWKTLHLFAVDRQASNDGWETNLPQPFQVLQTSNLPWRGSRNASILSNWCRMGKERVKWPIFQHFCAYHSAMMNWSNSGMSQGILEIVPCLC